MSQGPFTAEHFNALNEVDLQLYGIEHGTHNLSQGLTGVEGVTDDDYAALLSATQKLTPERGDVLAIEPAGFRTDQAVYNTLEDVVPFTVPSGVSAEMSP